jgi:hypothetical protein
MVRITVASMLAVHQGKSRVMLRPAGLLGGEYMAASCAKALRKKFWLHHIWGFGEIFATRCLHPVTLALGHDGSSPATVGVASGWEPGELMAVQVA